MNKKQAPVSELCYSNLMLRVKDRGENKQVLLQLEGAKRFAKVLVWRNGREPINGRSDKDILSDEAMDDLVEQVKVLAEQKELPCNCADFQTKQLFCTCVKPENILHPRKWKTGYE